MSLFNKKGHGDIFTKFSHHLCIINSISKFTPNFMYKTIVDEMALLIPQECFKLSKLMVNFGNVVLFLCPEMRLGQLAQGLHFVIRPSSY